MYVDILIQEIVFPLTLLVAGFLGLYFSFSSKDNLSVFVIRSSLIGQPNRVNGG